ncbi:MAG: hypothetical protein V4754_09510 [Pseudomonadota bacterium]
MIDHIGIPVGGIERGKRGHGPAPAALACRRLQHFPAAVAGTEAGCRAP